MNVASLLNPPRTDGPTPSALKLLRVETGLLAQALLGSIRESTRESVLAFRFMRSLLLNGAASVPLK
ncbi:hypothetical protein [Archangium lansingense]|uniref:Uncharacterized protein n=1 Tax=Archangium lansingense TaxID=2995310 RepID=A0ABT4AIM0_9BACT|nr:hypothetical protein [Archangium lansinium]MCY1081507.1 hypothetical protein [Archangium lansinium]